MLPHKQEAYLQDSEFDETLDKATLDKANAQ